MKTTKERYVSTKDCIPNIYVTLVSSIKTIGVRIYKYLIVFQLCYLLFVSDIKANKKPMTIDKGKHLSIYKRNPICDLTTSNNLVTFEVVYLNLATFAPVIIFESISGDKMLKMTKEPKKPNIGKGKSLVFYNQKSHP